MTVKIGFIGAGKMAEAIMAGLIARTFAAPEDLLASDISEERRTWVGQRYKVRTTPRNADVAAHAEMVFLAVKPQQLDGVLREWAPHATSRHLVVSIAAGKRIEQIEAWLPVSRVVRVMPNMACLVGEGMNVFALGARASAADGARVAAALDCCGRTLELPERLFDAVTALSGSGPAFFAYLLDRLADGAVQEGLGRAEALLLAEQTMLGTARLLRDLKMEPSDLAAAVTSAKGTTAAGREVLETEAVAGILNGVIRAAARRSRELSRA
jgi:pyrroline-5-carboxylate reductase